MITKYGIKALSLLIVFLFSAMSVYTHSGRTDTYGGHYDRINGGYYYHNSGSVGSVRLQRTTPNKRSTEGVTNSRQNSETTQAIIDAKTDVQEPYGWFIGTFLSASACGCLGGSVVILSSQIIEPSLPIHRLIGKSPEYVAHYAETYQREVKSKRLLYTGIGCLGGTVVAVLLWTDLYTE